ncbi:T9SS type A sorting domain-containing protein [Aquimarina sp. AU58]|uniref:T9SS type A sorting domain-containing protein n=1 Tax=Aquimarina sp. AU58 TaxID=1874112 RepID=UPI000D6E209B|nr:T9SS type A sorting domain-containing protein [Aquimarina sp. AU58]
MNYFTFKPKGLVYLSLIVGFLFINLTSYAQKLNGEKTIDPNKPESSTNFNSFTSAINALNRYGINGPVTFNVATGSYSEQLNITKVQGTYFKNTITFQSATGRNEDVVLEYTPTLDKESYVVMFDSDVEFFNFRNMTFVNSSEHSDGVFLFYPNAHDITLYGNKIISKNTSYDDAFLEDSSSLILCLRKTNNITVSNNYLANARYGIKTINNYNNFYSFLISDNVMEYFERYAIDISGESHIIDDNEIRFSSTGISCKVDQNDLSGVVNHIRGNYIHDITNYGIICDAGKIINNVIDNPSSQYGTCLYSRYAKADIKIEHNTMKSVGDYARVLHFEAKSSEVHISVMNNNFYHDGTHNPLMEYGFENKYYIHSSYNNLYTKEKCGKILKGIGSNGWSVYAYTRKELRTLGFGLGSRQIKPLFYDGVLHAANSSLQFGTDLRFSVPTDREGNLHSATPYVGASIHIPNPDPDALSGILNVPGDYPTIEEAVTDLTTKGISSSVTIKIAAGTYPGIKIPFIPGVSDDYTVTFTGPEDTRDQVIIDGGNKPALTLLQSAKHISFNNTTITSTINAVHIVDNVSKVTLSNNMIQSTTNQGNVIQIDPFHNDRILIDNNTISGGNNSIYSNNEYCGNTYNENYGITVARNTIENFNTTGVALNEIGRFTIVDNEISSNTNMPSTGINITYSFRGKISGNTIQNIEKRGINIYYTRGGIENLIEVSNNRVFVNNDVYTNTSAKGITLTLSSRINLYNNVISVEDHLNEAVHGASLERVNLTFMYHNSIRVHSNRDNAAVIFYDRKTDRSRYNEFFNNIFSQTGTGEGYIYNIKRSEQSMGKLNNNVLHHTGTHIAFFEENLETITNWRYKTGQDANSEALNPEFVSNTDLHATNDAILGVAKELTTHIITSDIDGKLRKTPPTVGAYENGDAGTPPVEDPIVLINEVDVDSEGQDELEFIELYDGGVGNTPLDGYVLVFYNGSYDKSYNSYDLDGYVTDDNGYFVIGNQNVANVSYTFANNKLQNGADAVALYKREEVLSNSSIITTEDLIDAVVYDTNDDDDAELLVLLNSDEPQINEGEKGDKDFHSIQRFPNGSGGLRNTNTYTQAIPTPGAANTDAVTVDDNKAETIATGFSIYPNPTASSVNINLPPATKSVKVMLFDLNGRLFVERTIDNSTSIDMSHLTSGLYIIHLLDDNGDHTKVMKLQKL